MSGSSSENQNDTPHTAVASDPTLQLDGPGVLGWAHTAVKELSERRAEINALNVFPVPDADTGSNMTHTMTAALDEALKVTDTSDVARMTAALAVGSVRGARGNSGVVLSQVLRAISQAAANGVINGHTVQEALGIARSLVDRAITDPVEGTVVTVLRSAAIEAEHSVENGEDDLLSVVRNTVKAARTALARTPSQLAVLREAGVVDAGGQGLVILLESLLAQIDPSMTREEHRSRQGESAESNNAEGAEDQDSHGRVGNLEVMFFITCDTEAALNALESTLQEYGDSLIIARETDNSAMVHIHSRRAGELIEQAFASGEVKDLRLEILPETRHSSIGQPRRVLMAVAPYGLVAELYSSAGVNVIPREIAQLHAADPSDDIVAKIVSSARKSGADEVILLPNGLLSKRELVSIERSSHAFEQNVIILPTSTLVSGIAAVAVHDPAQPIAVDSYAMAEAAGAMRTAVVRAATSAALTQAGACSKGDLLTFIGPEIVQVSEELNEALARTALRLLDGGGEQITLLILKERQHEFDEDIFRRGLGTHTGVEITVYPASGMENLVEIGVE
ncbi:DAK2 domain-containing protein [Corynebacterium callunae]|uniref:DAK2 domain-containing protein n=1 Tax=Corynebacterium callunae TaxID=1721 RepID=UPI001FFE2E49|nr:DAK2 domain-containing protein [Corynebacterium callunae]MCK2200549.1 DAK2 domain-containing protein [Corynebacterium callunae]